MNKEQLLNRKEQIQTKFNEVERKRGEAETEMARLQGEFRLINDLLKELEPTAAPDESN